MSVKTSAVTDNISGGELTITENATIGKNVTIGEPGRGNTTFTNNNSIHNELAGYRSVTADGTKVEVFVDGTIVEKEIEDNHFITKRFFDKNGGGGGGGNDVTYTLEVTPQTDGFSSQAVDYSDIVLMEDDNTTADPPQVAGLVRLQPGSNIKLVSDDGAGEIEISADATRVIFSDNAPLPVADYIGNLWYNTLDGRTYVAYEDPGVDGDPNLPPSMQWVDASPSAINGGDYVYRYGDEVENYLYVNGRFNATHYKLDRLPQLGTPGVDRP